jgi:hypothetical protein
VETILTQESISANVAAAQGTSQMNQLQLCMSNFRGQPTCTREARHNFGHSSLLGHDELLCCTCFDTRVLFAERLVGFSVSGMNPPNAGAPHGDFVLYFELALTTNTRIKGVSCDLAVLVAKARNWFRKLKLWIVID